ncbi:tyrosine-type recombinase/integrase [uncultured Nocardioides sp.]|uniref:tyrosine-type recombinase/integrase n=1 Tax=uncultured Nocardioides sp. TaxID=198441 RepID=UPI00345717A9
MPSPASTLRRLLPRGLTEAAPDLSSPRGSPWWRECHSVGRPRPDLATRNGTWHLAPGTWHQVGNIERRWRAIRTDTGFDWVTPHTFRKTVATLIDRLVDSDTAARLLGHSSDAITKEFYIEKDRTTPDVSQILQSFAGGTRTIASDTDVVGPS